MPFDDTSHSSGGGGDGHNDPTEEVVNACIDAAVMTATLNGACVPCTMAEVGIDIVVRVLISNAKTIRDNADLHHGNPHMAVADFVRELMQEIANRFSEKIPEIFGEDKDNG